MAPGTYWDGTEVRGFGITVGKKNKTFILKYRTASGIQRWLTIGRYGELTVRQAIKLAAQKRTQIAQGADPAKELADQRSCATVEELLAVYKEEHFPSLKPKTRRRYENIIDHHLVPKAGRKKTNDFDHAFALHLHTRITKEGGDVTASLAAAIMSGAFRHAIGTGSLKGTNPYQFIKRKKSKERTTTMTLSQIELVLEELESPNYNLFARACLKVLLYTGARLDEIRCLKWNQVHLDRMALLIDDHKSDRKTGTKIIWLNESAKAVLESLPREGEYVFPGKIKAICGVVPDVWDVIRRKLKLTNVTIHDFRHTFISVLFNNGFNLDTIGKVTGQSGREIVHRYSHLFDDTSRKVAGTIDTVLTKKKQGSIK